MKRYSFLLILLLIGLMPFAICQDTPFLPELGLDDVFPSARFDFPVEIKPRKLPISGSNETEEFLYVVTRAGQIFSVDPATGVSELFLDISSMVEINYDFGLFGLAFHPNFLNGTSDFFIHYNSVPNGDTIISRWEFDLETRLPVDSSEEIIFTLARIGTVHRGGSINFGPDGFLYFLSGDGGASDDLNERVQGLDTLYGKGIRIDVDSPPADGLNYAIPADNPLVGMGSNGTREEIIAVGFRNPFSWSIDEQTGLVWLGDVGSSFREEIDVIVPNFVMGQVPNYGWNSAEGDLCLDPNETVCDGFVDPVFDYGRDIGTTVIGGYVYRGDIPELNGMYIYGDFTAGRIWALEFNPLNASDSPVNHFLFEIPDLVTTFGVDSQGNLYLTYFNGGAVLKFSVNGGVIPDLGTEDDADSNKLTTAEIFGIALGICAFCVVCLVSYLSLYIIHEKKKRDDNASQRKF